MKTFPLPARAASIASAAPRCSAFAEFNHCIGRARGFRQNLRVIERAAHRLDAELSQRLGGFGRARQSAHRMASIDEMHRQRATDITASAGNEYLHGCEATGLAI